MIKFTLYSKFTSKSKVTLNKLKPIAIDGSISRKRGNSPGNKIGICFCRRYCKLLPSPISKEDETRQNTKRKSLHSTSKITSKQGAEGGGKKQPYSKAENFIKQAKFDYYLLSTEPIRPICFPPALRQTFFWEGGAGEPNSIKSK